MVEDVEAEADKVSDAVPEVAVTVGVETTTGAARGSDKIPVAPTGDVDKNSVPPAVTTRDANAVVMS